MRRSLVISALFIALAWPASVAATYWLTREKWYDLGILSGEIGGKSEVLAELCELSHPGTATSNVIWSLAVKASSVELVLDGDELSLFCQ